MLYWNKLSAVPPPENAAIIFAVPLYDGEWKVSTSKVGATHWAVLNSPSDGSPLQDALQRTVGAALAFGIAQRQIMSEGPSADDYIKWFGEYGLDDA